MDKLEGSGFNLILA